MGFRGNPLHVFWTGLYPGTPAERALEPYIASLGHPYRTQFPYFIWGLKMFPDFVMPTVGIVLEVDDPSHEETEKQKADAVKASTLEDLGWRVLRCSNWEAFNAPSVVIGRIQSVLATQGHRDLSHLFPPRPSKRAKPKPRRRSTPPPQK